MKKLSGFALLLVLALTAAACSGGAVNATPGVGTVAPNEVGTSTTGLGYPTSETGAMPTSEVGTVPTTEVGGGGSITATPEVSTGGGVISSTSAVGGAVSTSEATSAAVSGTSVPATGGKQFGEFARLQELIGLSVQGSKNESLGTISDFVINLPKTRVDFIVLNYNGSSILVPWSTLAFSTTGNNVFTFNGNMDLLQKEPAFDANNLDWFSETWNKDVLMYWASGANSGVSATTVAGTSVPATGSSTVMPTESAPSSTAVPMVTGVPATGGQVRIAILASQLANIKVVESAGGVGTGTVMSTPAAGGTSVAATPESTHSASTVAPSTTTMSGASSGVVVGQNVGTVQDAIVNLVSGDLPFMLISASNIPATGAGSSSTPAVGSSNTAEPMATVSPESTSSSSTVGTSVPATGGGSVILVPSSLLKFIGNDTAVLMVPASMLNNAPTLDLSNVPALTQGWVTETFNFWNTGGKGTSGGTGTGGGSVTPTP